jgi:hypothetical protein
MKLGVIVAKTSFFVIRSPTVSCEYIHDGSITFLLKAYIREMRMKLFIIPSILFSEEEFRKVECIEFFCHESCHVDVDSHISFIQFAKSYAPTQL